MMNNSYEEAESEFDRLRKRVTYLTKGRRTSLPVEGVNDGVPSNMQIFQGFIEEDERKKKAQRDAKLKAGYAKKPGN